jgi:PTH1 family peptidyl-tRNA hydrolase
MLVDHLATEWSVTCTPDKSMQAVVGTGLSRNRQKVILAKPTTYMNLSGEATQKLLQYYKLSTEQVLVVYDDVALPYGKLRLRAAGSDGGQKGMRSIIQCLGQNNTLSRLRIGIGAAPEQQDLSDYVLSAFSQEETQKLPEIIDMASRAVEHWMDYDIESAMTRFNAG